jgi:hypothetical protein
MFFFCSQFSLVWGVNRGFSLVADRWIITKRADATPNPPPIFTGVIHRLSLRSKLRTGLSPHYLLSLLRHSCCHVWTKAHHCFCQPLARALVFGEYVIVSLLHRAGWGRRINARVSERSDCSCCGPGGVKRPYQGTKGSNRRNNGWAESNRRQAGQLRGLQVNLKKFSISV